MLSPSHRSTPKLSSIRTDYSKPTTVNSPSLISPLLSKVGSKTEISNNESKQQPVLVLAIPSLLTDYKISNFVTFSYSGSMRN